ncbi:major tail protein, partial [Ruminococcus sp.]|uniref:major tail protein n=1 Tax=Ruminococcus sp. TaxID=41978 RepID=UPI00344B79F3
DANGENENFYADNSVYYVINNNAGYDGDLEVALITTDFATAILGEQLDAKGVRSGRRGDAFRRSGRASRIHL